MAEHWLLLKADPAGSRCLPAVLALTWLLGAEAIENASPPSGSVRSPSLLYSEGSGPVPGSACRSGSSTASSPLSERGSSKSFRRLPIGDAGDCEGEHRSRCRRMRRYRTKSSARSRTYRKQTKRGKKYMRCDGDHAAQRLFPIRAAFVSGSDNASPSQTLISFNTSHRHIRTTEEHVPSSNHIR